MNKYVLQLSAVVFLSGLAGLFGCGEGCGAMEEPESTSQGECLERDQRGQCIRRANG